MMEKDKTRRKWLITNSEDNPRNSSEELTLLADWLDAKNCRDQYGDVLLSKKMADQITEQLRHIAKNIK